MRSAGFLPLTSILLLVSAVSCAPKLATSKAGPRSTRDTLAASPSVVTTGRVYIPDEVTGPEIRMYERAKLLDCNCNGVYDSLDVVKGVLHDSNRDGNPDECEAEGSTDDCDPDTT